MDIGLRNIGLFGALESWQGCFEPVFRDGPFVGAGRSYLSVNEPTLLVQKHAAILRHDGVPFYVSVGGNHGHVLREWLLDFSSLLERLRIPNNLWQAWMEERRHF